MTNGKIMITAGLLCLLLAAPGRASDELLSIVLEEQQAFEQGDCDKVESLLHEDITFYANGKKMTREQVGNFCRSIPRPFGAGRAPLADTTTPYVLSETSGYTVRDFLWQGKNDRVVHEVVTKVWRKDDSGWKMIHFQSTVVPERTRSQQGP